MLHDDSPVSVLVEVTKGKHCLNSYFISYLNH